MVVERKDIELDIFLILILEKNRVRKLLLVF